MVEFGNDKMIDLGYLPSFTYDYYDYEDRVEYSTDL